MQIEREMIGYRWNWKKGGSGRGVNDDWRDEEGDREKIGRWRKKIRWLLWLFITTVRFFSLFFFKLNKNQFSLSSHVWYSTKYSHATCREKSLFNLCITYFGWFCYFKRYCVEWQQHKLTKKSVANKKKKKEDIVLLVPCKNVIIWKITKKLFS